MFVALNGDRFVRTVDPSFPEIVPVPEMIVGDKLEVRTRLFKRVKWAENFGRGFNAEYQSWCEYREVAQ